MLEEFYKLGALQALTDAGLTKEALAAADVAAKMKSLMAPQAGKSLLDRVLERLGRMRMQAHGGPTVTKMAAGPMQVRETAYALGKMKVPDNMAKLYHQPNIPESFMSNSTWGNTNAVGEGILGVTNKLEKLHGRRLTPDEYFGIYNKRLLRRMRRFDTLAPQEQKDLTGWLADNHHFYGKTKNMYI